MRLAGGAGAGCPRGIMAVGVMIPLYCDCKPGSCCMKVKKKKTGINVVVSVIVLVK